MMMKTLYATSLYLLITTCLTSVYGLAIEPRTTSTTMQNSFVVGKCMFLESLQSLITLNDCGISPLWDITPSETNFNEIKLSGSNLCLTINAERKEVSVSDCINARNQRFLFNAVGQVISDLSNSLCVAAKIDNFNLEVATCSSDQHTIWVPS